MEKFDENQNQHLDKQECKPLLQGVMTGLDKQYEDSVMEKYYTDKTFCQDQDLGIDKKGLFKVLCDINDLDVPEDDFFLADKWRPELNALETFDINQSEEFTHKWPELGVA